MEKGYLHQNLKFKSKVDKRTSIVSAILLNIGIVISLSSMLYLIANISIADSIIEIWLPFMLAGVFLIFFSQMIKLYWRSRQKRA